MDTKIWTLRLVDELDATNEMIINRLSKQDVNYLVTGVVDYLNEEIIDETKTVIVNTANYEKSVYNITKKRNELQISME